MGYSILIVDDSATTRIFIRRVVAMMGLEADAICEAGDGAAGLEQLRSRPFDLVFADLHMPVVDGAEMVRQMRADDRLKNIPVLVVSAEPDQDRLDGLRAGGVAGYLRKPFTPEELRAAVRPIVGGVQ